MSSVHTKKDNLRYLTHAHNNGQNFYLDTIAVAGVCKDNGALLRN